MSFELSGYSKTERLPVFTEGKYTVGLISMLHSRVLGEKATLFRMGQSPSVGVY